jgi:hypothetical protein
MMRIDRNIFTVILHLGILFSPLTAKITHHHTINKLHGTDFEIALSESQKHCHICEFEYLPYLKANIPEKFRIEPPRSLDEIQYSNNFFIQSKSVLSLRAPPEI